MFFNLFTNLPPYICIFVVVGNFIGLFVATLWMCAMGKCINTLFLLVRTNLEHRASNSGVAEELNEELTTL